MQTKIPVTVVVPVKNEEKNLPQCLKLLDDFSEVIVADSGSTDATPQITVDFGYRLVDFKWDGHFPKKRNWTLRNIPLKNEWVLFLDADEFITDEFKKELIAKINLPEYNGFWVTYSNHFLGKSLKHGIKFKKLPLFRVSKGEYEFIDEDAWSHLDMEVHEHPIIEGNVGKIKSPIIHLDFKGLSHYIAKHNEYSTWEACRYLKLLETEDKKLTFKQKVKYRLMNTWIFGFLYFLLNYFVFLGFLDGRIGYVFSVYKMQYFFSIKAKIYELTKIKNHSK
jgi:glycosyltransferase involved in cell wall biosynthesis